MSHSATTSSRARQTLIFASATHIWSDFFFALLVPLLILIKEDPELNLTYTQVGLLRTVHTGASAALQVPFGFLAERVGEFWLLLGGNVWVAAGLVALAAAHGFQVIFWATLLGGLGGGTQHPLASSLVSRVYEGPRRSTAVGTVNFAGDPGKMAAPALAWLLAIPYGWRTAMRVAGLAGLAFMGLAAVARKGGIGGRPSREGARADTNTGSATNINGFIDLSVVGFVDSWVRAAALTFLPFLMSDKGMSTPQIFGLLILLLAGGAAGKFVCGWLDDRYGSVRLIWGTKGLSAALLLATLASPAVAMAPLMIVLGIGLNGTSSVLYATVAKFVPPRLRGRYYGMYYTAGEGAGALAPVIFGLIADLTNIRTTTAFLAIVTGMILPVSLPLRRHLAPDKLAAWSETE